MRHLASTALAIALAGLAQAAAAQPFAQGDVELTFYLGAQSATHSSVEGNDSAPGGVGPFDFSVDWEGQSDEFPPYYGGRATWFRDGVNGFGFELTHQKAAASEDTLDDNPGFDELEFTDGLNFATLNYVRRLPARGRITPHLGGGLGFAFPYVEIETGGTKIDEFQITGPVVAAFAGGHYDLTDRIALFGEYKITYSSHEVDLEDGGELETDLVTNALSLGLTYRF